MFVKINCHIDYICDEKLTEKECGIAIAEAIEVCEKGK